MGLTKKCYVYRFVDIDSQTCYVGETNNISRRINQHLTFQSGKFTPELLQNVHKIEYFTVNNKVEARQIEIYYINKYKPYLNKADKFKHLQISTNDSYEKKWRLYKILNNNVRTSPGVNRTAVAISYAMFICTILMFLSAYF